MSIILCWVQWYTLTLLLRCERIALQDCLLSSDGLAPLDLDRLAKRSIGLVPTQLRMEVSGVREEFTLTHLGKSINNADLW